MQASGFVKNCFKAYYEAHAHEINVPSLEQREFGFGFEKKIDFRHKSFSNEREFRNFLKNEVPLFASYSAARYSLPSARPMQRKGFLGADLAFDLDKSYEEEHGQKHNKIVCRLCLKRAFEDALRFHEEFLLGDFGFAKHDVKTNFSGGKGVHFHVRSKAVQELSSDARKELCDYAAGFEISSQTMLADFGEGKRSQLRGPSASSRGWAGKIYAHAKNLLEKADEKTLVEKGLSKQKALRLLKEKNNVLNAMARGNWDYLLGMREFWSMLADECVRLHRIEPDKPVTFDLARLIRVPNTLHGGTGFVAKQIPVLSAFEPLNDALAFSSGGQEVICSQDASIELANQLLEFRAGLKQVAPLSAALLLVLKGVAVVVQ